MTANNKTDSIAIFLLVIIASCLHICNLGNHYLWQDEAQTALISKTILTEGVPRGFDGTNYFSQEEGAEYGENYIWKWHTWLPFYIVAAFFKLFGISTFVARLPFALFGIGTVILTYLFCRKFWDDRKIAIAAGFLILTSIPFIILSRQCRYYSMSVFFSMWGLYAYIGILDKKKYSSLCFVIANTLLFHTHYIYCATLLATVFIHSLICEREHFKRIFILSVITVLINGPWIIWLSSMKYGDKYGSILLLPQKLKGFSLQYIRLMFRYIFSPFLFLIIPVCFVAKVIKNKAAEKDKTNFSKYFLLLLFIFINYAALVVASPWPFFRYLSPVIPAVIILSAALIVSTSRIHLLIPFVIIAILLFTGHLKDFCYELTHDYDGPLEGISKYLNENSGKGDIVLITYGDMPLKFYTDLRIMGGLTGENLSMAPEADWIITRKHTISGYTKPVFEHIKTLNPTNYQRIVIGYPDIPFENREEPALHQYRTDLNEDRVVIHRRK